MRGRKLWLWAALSVSLCACGDDETATTRDDGGDSGLGRDDGGDGDGDGDASQRDASQRDASDPQRDAGPADAASDADMDAELGDGGDQPDGSDDPLVPLTIDDYCSEVRAGLCDWLARCRGFESCGSWGGMPGVVARCDAALVAFAAGRVSFDGDAAAHCVRAHRSGRCEGPPPIVLAQNGTANTADALRCTEVFGGRVANGQACYVDNTLAGTECASGACYRAGGQCPGECIARRSLGETCSESIGLRCEPELYCNSPSAECAERLLEGDACDREVCAHGLGCVRTDGEEESYACHRIASAVGEACSAFGACPSGSSCDDGVCVATVGSGEPCLADSQCASDERCLPTSTGQGPQRCRDRFVALGGICGVGECVAPALCYPLGDDEYALCRLPGELGEPCQSYSCAAGLYCQYGGEQPVCATPIADGESCADNPDGCAQGLLCMRDGLCHPPGELSEACDSAQTGSCVAGRFCSPTTQTCAAPSAEDGLCNPGEARESCLAGLYCDCTEQAPWCSEGYTSPPSGTYACVPQLALGQTCSIDAQCASGNCATQLRECAAAGAGEGFVGCIGP